MCDSRKASIFSFINLELGTFYFSTLSDCLMMLKKMILIATHQLDSAFYLTYFSRLSISDKQPIKFAARKQDSMN